ncbi:hypothetical protein [Marivirga atlantica]|jgi:hypothetical protein|uniref:Uncharacterized protein n=1 Tax=Marivirga atlantica TaxID=1548457 RepID=A0A937AB26_9BACT|nr:hypothetical protein [Marivirga atlantica]MBL0765626.1 hypothetical protein [Marivirga atlantica]
MIKKQKIILYNPSSLPEVNSGQALHHGGVCQYEQSKSLKWAFSIE